MTVDQAEKIRKVLRDMAQVAWLTSRTSDIEKVLDEHVKQISLIMGEPEVWVGPPGPPDKTDPQ